MGVEYPARKLLFPEAELPELHVEFWNSLVRSAYIRVATKHGLLQYDFAGLGDYTKQTATFRLPDIPLFLQVYPSNVNTRRGSMYVNIQLRMGGFPVATLISGYLTGMHPLTWPPGFHEHSVGGAGYPRSVTGTNPAAGAEISETVPTNTRWLFHGFSAQLVVDATVANRRPSLVIDDGTTILMRIIASSVQTASQTLDWSVTHVGFDLGIASSRGILAKPPEPLPLLQGWRIRTVTESLQAGDNWGAPQLFVEEFLEE